MPSSFPDYIVNDLLASVPGMSYQAMFGGFAVYKDGLIVACVMDDELYLKVDDSNRADFEQRGSRPFVFTAKNGKRMTMGYWLIPSDIMEDRNGLSEWVMRSYAVSKKAAQRKSLKKAKGK